MSDWPEFEISAAHALARLQATLAFTADSAQPAPPSNCMTLLSNSWSP